MKKSLLKKVSVNTVLSIALVSSIGSVALADPNQTVQVTQSVEKIAVAQEQKLSKMTIDEIISDPFYKDLPMTPEKISYYKEIERFKKENPHLQADQIVEHFEKQSLSRSSVSPSGIYDDAKKLWFELTPQERYLVVTNPAVALIIDSCREKAERYTLENYFKSGAGDISDAFRHATWNALMCKYASKAWAWSYGNAHEAQTDEYFRHVFPDGFTGRQHSDMDLHNNQKGRDCWNIVTDSIAWTSDGELQNRVIAKIRAGEMVTLHD